jgi:hypothetical protein
MVMKSKKAGGGFVRPRLPVCQFSPASPKSNLYPGQTAEKKAVPKVKAEIVKIAAGHHS